MHPRTPIFTSIHFFYTLSSHQHSPITSYAKLFYFRVKITSEVLSGIRSIKFLGWEADFIAQITAIRKLEMKYLAIRYGEECMHAYVLREFVRVSMRVWLVRVRARMRI